MQANQPPNDEHTEMSVENFEIVGAQLLEWMGYLLRDSSVRQIRIRAPGGQLLFEAAEDRGMWGDGIMGLGPPWPGVLGAVAAMVARMTIEVTRVGAAPGEEIVTLSAERKGRPTN